MLFIWEKRNLHLQSKAPLSSSFSSWRKGEGGGETWRVGSRTEPFSPLESHFLSEGCQPLTVIWMLKKGEIVAWSLERMSLHTSQLRKPVVTPSHDHNRPSSHLPSTPPPPAPSQVTQTDWKGSSKKLPLPFLLVLWVRWLKGQFPEKQSKDFCPFSHLLQQICCGRIFGNGNKYKCKKKKKSVYE